MNKSVFKFSLLVALFATIILTFTACQKDTNPVSASSIESSNTTIANGLTLKTGAKPDLSSLISKVKAENALADSKNSNVIQDGDEHDDHDGDNDHDGDDCHDNDWEKIGFNINIGVILNGIALDRTQTRTIKNYLESYEECYESAKKSIKTQIEALKKNNEKQSEAIKKALKKGTITKAAAAAQLAELTATTNSSIASLQSIAVGCDCLDTLFTNIYNNSGLNDSQRDQFLAWAGTLSGLPCPLTILVPTGGGVSN